MKHRYVAILFIFIGTFLSLHGDGFVADTLVRTPQGYVPIQNLRVHDEVLSRDKYGRLIAEPITHIAQHRTKKLIDVHVNDTSIHVDHDHAFFVPQTNAWIKAEDVQSEQYLLRDPLQVGLVDCVRHLKESAIVYSLSLAKHHTYCISDQDITVHNAAPALMLAATAAKSGGILTTFLAANPLVAPVTIAVGGIALLGYVTWTLIDGFRSNNKETSKSSQQSSKKEDKKGKDNSKDPKNTDPEFLGSAAALLKAIDENKEKAVEVFNRTYEWLQSSKGLSSIQHCFRNNNFFLRMGGKSDATELKIIADITQQLINKCSELILDAQDVFKNVLIEYGGEVITVQGRVHDGMIKISTMYIRPQHLR